MEQEKNKEEITTINELAVMIRDSFQGNQDYMDKRFDEMKSELKADINVVEKKLSGEIKKLGNKLDGFVDDYSSEKLPIRVEYIENVLNLPKK